MSPAVPPKPPLRTAPNGRAGCRVSPASEVTGSAPCSTRSFARSRASRVPPRTKMRLPCTGDDSTFSSDDHDVGLDPGAAQCALDCPECNVRNKLADIESHAAAQIENLSGGISFGDCRSNGRRHPLREPRKINLASPRMQVERSLREFHKLPKSAANRNPRYRVLAEILEKTASEVAHIDHCFKWQVVEGADSAFRCRSGAAGEVIEANRAGD